MMVVANTYENFTSLFNTFLILAILVATVVLGLMTYLIVKNRDRGPASAEPEDAPRLGRLPPERGKLRTVILSLSLSVIILGTLIVGTFGAIDMIQTPPPQSALEVTVVGFQWGWKFIYPNGNETLGELRVPTNGVVKLKVTSQDVFHNFGIPDFKIKIDAIPGRVNHIWFIVYQPGTYTILCFEFCGTGHAYMLGKLIAMEPSEFQSWYSSL